MADTPLASIIVAVIGAISAVSTSIYASIKTTKNSKQLTELETELTKQKELTLEYMKAYIVLENEERQRALAAFKELIRLVQLFREQMKRVLEHPDSFSTSLLSKEMSELAQNISDTYASNQMFFGDDRDVELVHRLKNRCVSAVTLLDRFLRTRDDKDVEQLRQIEAAIGYEQMHLRVRAREFATRLIDEMKAQIIQKRDLTDGKQPN